MILDAGDPGTAERLTSGPLGEHVVERFGDSALAIAATSVRAVEAALRRAGHELEPGVDRISGRFDERDAAQTDAELAWSPARAQAGGQLVSTLPSRAPDARNVPPAARLPLRLGDGVGASAAAA